MCVYEMYLCVCMSVCLSVYLRASAYVSENVSVNVCVKMRRNGMTVLGGNRSVCAKADSMRVYMK